MSRYRRNAMRAEGYYLANRANRIERDERAAEERFERFYEEWGTNYVLRRFSSGESGETEDLHERPYLGDG